MGDAFYPHTQSHHAIAGWMNPFMKGETGTLIYHHSSLLGVMTTRQGEGMNMMISAFVHATGCCCVEQ